MGQVGCADTGIVLARGPQGATLYARGRDIEEVEHAVLFSGDTCRWTILGEAAEVRRSETRKWSWSLPPVLRSPENVKGGHQRGVSQPEAALVLMAP